MPIGVRRPRAALLLTGALVLAGIGVASASADTTAHRVVAYYQTQDSGGNYVSPLPLNGIATDVELAAFHLNTNGTIHLNNDPPSAAKYDQMWSDLATLQRSGVHVSAMLGGAATGSYANLHKNFAVFYPLLKSTLQTYHFDGIDLDIEEVYPLPDVKYLINQLRADFGNDFIITLAPYALDLTRAGSEGLFSYAQLERDLGSKINWYNAQFYCGWGSLATTADYNRGVSGTFPASRIVAGAVTNPDNCAGYVDPGTLADTVRTLTAEHPDLAGVAGWEYFNSVGVNGGGPESWFRNVKDAMG